MKKNTYSTIFVLIFSVAVIFVSITTDASAKLIIPATSYARINEARPSNNYNIPVRSTRIQNSSPITPVSRFTTTVRGVGPVSSAVNNTSRASTGVVSSTSFSPLSVSCQHAFGNFGVEIGGLSSIAPGYTAGGYWKSTVTGGSGKNIYSWEGTLGNIPTQLNAPSGNYLQPGSYKSYIFGDYIQVAYNSTGVKNASIKVVSSDGQTAIGNCTPIVVR